MKTRQSDQRNCYCRSRSASLEYFTRYFKVACADIHRFVVKSSLSSAVRGSGSLRTGGAAERWCVPPLAGRVEGRQRLKRARKANFKIQITTLPDHLHKLVLYHSIHLVEIYRMALSRSERSCYYGYRELRFIYLYLRHTWREIQIQ